MGILATSWIQAHRQYLSKPTEKGLNSLIELLSEITSFAELEEIYPHLVPDSPLEIATRQRMEQLIAGLNVFKLPAWFIDGVEKGLYFSRWPSSKKKAKEYIAMIIQQLFFLARMNKEETAFFEVSFVDTHTQFSVLCVEPLFGLVRAEEETDVHKNIRRLLHLIPAVSPTKEQQKKLCAWFGNYYVEGGLSFTADRLKSLLVYQDLNALLLKKEAELKRLKQQVSLLEQTIKTAKEKMKQ